MSTYRGTTLLDRLVIIHDMPDCVVVSELDAEDAKVLFQQMVRAEKALKQSSVQNQSRPASFRIVRIPGIGSNGKTCPVLCITCHHAVPAKPAAVPYL